MRTPTPPQWRQMRASLIIALTGGCPLCPDASTDPTPSNTPVALRYVSGSGTVAANALATTVTLEVRVLAAGDELVKDAEVLWSPASSFSFGPSLSDANGIARADFTVSPGSHTATATLHDKPSEVVTFQVRFEAPTAITKITGDNAIGSSAGKVTLAVKVLSNSNAPFKGAAVTWFVPATEISIGAGVSPSTSVSGDDGIAATTWTLPAALGGPYHVTAGITGAFPITPASFSGNVVACKNSEVIAPNDFDFAADVGLGWTVIVDKTNLNFSEGSGYLTTGGSTAIAGSTGPNPGGFRKMQHNENGIGTITVFHRRELPYDPNAAGNEIDHINYSEDFIEFEPPFGGAAIGHGFYFEQNGQRFAKALGTGAFTNTLSWMSGGMTVTAADFTGETFGSGGLPIKFGFYRANSNDGAALLTTKHGIDNWRVEICKK